MQRYWFLLLLLYGYTVLAQPRAPMQVRYQNKYYWLGAPASDTLNNTPFKYYQEYDSSGRFLGTTERFPKDGDWINFYQEDSTRVASTWQVRSGLSDGIAIQYRWEGPKWSEYEFHAGLQDGFVRYWNQAGRLVLEQQYQVKQDNWQTFEERTGTWRSWNDQGVLLEQQFFIDNEPHGQQSYFYENGQIHSMENYDHGLREGVWVWFHPNGRIQQEIRYEAGNCVDALPHQEYHANGRLAASGNLEDCLKSGYWTYFYDHGARESAGAYTTYVYRHEHGDFLFWVKTGTWTYWYPDGSLKARGDYDPASVAHEVLDAYPSAARAERTGVWVYYDAKGLRISRELFESTQQISDE